MPNTLEKLTSYHLVRARDLLPLIEVFISGKDCGEEIREEYKKREESINFIKSFIFQEKENPDFHDINDHLDEIKNFRRKLLHNSFSFGNVSSWRGANTLEMKIYDLIGIIERWYVCVRQIQDSSN